MKTVMTVSFITAGLISMASMAIAIDASDIISRMKTKGYTSIEISKTLFGNTSVVGITNGVKHTFILNKSGVILRESLQESNQKSIILTKPLKDKDKTKVDKDGSWGDKNEDKTKVDKDGSWGDKNENKTKVDKDGSWGDKNKDKTKVIVK